VRLTPNLGAAVLASRRETFNTGRAPPRRDREGRSGIVKGRSRGGARVPAINEL